MREMVETGSEVGLIDGARHRIKQPQWNLQSAAQISYGIPDNDRHSRKVRGARPAKRTGRYSHYDGKRGK